MNKIKIILIIILSAMSTNIKPGELIVLSVSLSTLFNDRSLSQLTSLSMSILSDIILSAVSKPSIFLRNPLNLLLIGYSDTKS